ncbi:MAG: CoA transferase, partial [Deltaproteobacteria bacterium]|nr:CoA transferase [Deltaproteobacteria bacterium]
RLFAGQSQAAWVELLQDADCCCEPVLKVKEALDLDQFKARDMVHWVETQGQRYFQADCPVKFEGFSPAPPQPARSPGQDSAEVLTGLGYSADEIERLREEGVV